MDTLISRPYAGQIDLQPVLELVRLCRAVEDYDPWPPFAEVRHFLRAKGNTPSADIQIWPRRRSALAAVAIFWDSEALLSYVHPEEPREEFLMQMVAWGMSQAYRLARRHGEQAILLVPICADDRHAAALLERNQLVAQDWSMLRMARSLDDPIPMPQVPPGFALRLATSQQELAAATALYQEVFGARSSVIRDRLALSRGASDIRALDLVAVAPNGALAAFCLCLADTHAGTQHERLEGWIDWLGTQPAFRQRGLGRAILRAGLGQLRDLGADIALLGTPSWNVAAQHLFASEGFQLLHHVRWFAWEAED